PRPPAKSPEGLVIHNHTERRKAAQRADRLPPLDLLVDSEIDGPPDQEITANARIIEATLRDFDVDAQVVSVRTGPTVTQYAVQPFREVQDEAGNWQMQRVRVNRIEALAGDLALALEAERLRIEAPVPGTNYIGIEVPNRRPSRVALRPLLESEQFHRMNRPLAAPLGRDVSGAPVIVDLGRMPHLLIAGTTGSGKSMCIASMVTSLLANNAPEDLKLILLDPKMVELMRFNGVPHLVGPVETDIERAIGVLHWATTEMDRRYERLEAAGTRNIDIYNHKSPGERLPYIVILIDEIGDMMLTMPDETEAAVCRLAQMARAVGMHLVMATQRPSTDIITGLIKANFPARLSFAVASGVDSRVILDTVGAESLLGNGDMLFLAPDASAPLRVQGAFVGDEEIEAVVAYWENQYRAAIEAGKAEAPPRLPPWERGLTRREVLAQTDELLEDAIELVVNHGRASTSLLQRRLGVGYPRAARIMGYLEELGIVGAAEAGGRARRVLIKPGEDKFRQLIDDRARRQ
ncbi:MAG: DNA translocase FtsK, partial [Anaerolineae bacterium]|nr:DNA translocase FtsK [Anaerolineae bacterium]